MAAHLGVANTLEIESLLGGATRLSVSKISPASLFFRVTIVLSISFCLSIGAVMVKLSLAAAVPSILCFTLFAGSVLVKSKLGERTITESIIVFPGLGVQIVSVQGRERFFPATDIDCFAISEGFERCRIVVYLVLVTYQKQCVVLFNDVRPGLPALVKTFEVLDTWLAQTKHGLGDAKQQNR